MPLPLAGIAAGVGIASGLKTIFSSSGRPDINRILRYIDARRPRGYLDPEDYAAAEGTRSRLSGQASRTAQGLRYEALRRYSQRRLVGSPAEETTLSRVGEIEAAGRERAGDVAEQQLYDIRLGRERYGQQVNLAALGYNVNEAYRNQARSDAQQSTFYNSLLESLKFLSRHYGAGEYTNEGEPEPEYA